MSLVSFRAEKLFPSVIYRQLVKRLMLKRRISELEEEKSNLRSALKEYSVTILDREASLAECEAVVRKRELIIEDREKTIQKHEKTIVARDVLIREQEARIRYILSTTKASLNKVNARIIELEQENNFLQAELKKDARADSI